MRLPRPLRLTLLGASALLLVGGVGLTFRYTSVANTLLGQTVPPPVVANEPPAPAPDSLKSVRPRVADELSTYVRDPEALTVLGKALFWDMQVGSDGVQACASCHFHAGADARVSNQINPGTDGMFQQDGPNGKLTAASFPFRKLQDPDDKTSPVLSDTDDRCSSQGVVYHQFYGVNGHAADDGTEAMDPPFAKAGLNCRRVEPRNTPTAINAVFNLRNFWDGRAQPTFNGVNPFGEQSASSRIYMSTNGEIAPAQFELHHSSLASQAVGPPMSPFEMSFDTRMFPHLGKKLCERKPLAHQEISPNDSVLGNMRDMSGRGLSTTYEELIKKAFVPALWDSQQIISCLPDCGAQPNCAPGSATIQPPLRPGGVLLREQFTLMQANFAVFFGVAVQQYEATLISDDAPFDRYREGDQTALSDQQKRGLKLFVDELTGARCIACHNGPDFTSAGYGSLVLEEPKSALMERMTMNDGGVAMYDHGFYNIGVRPPAEDKGVGGFFPPDGPNAAQPLSFTERFVNGTFNRFNNCEVEAPFPLLNCLEVPDVSVRQLETRAVDGAFKVPSLRNVELTGPYFHNGGQATLDQVVAFYNRGADFQPQSPDIGFIGLSNDQAADLVAFLKSLTDDRVRYEKAPFDHPELCVPDGHPSGQVHMDGGTITAVTTLMHLPPVGAGGGVRLSSFEEILNGTGPSHFDGMCPAQVTAP